jgi:UDP-N-acetylmuramoyl-tripeptide--D-alanyl-D-alanine ligase
LGRRRSLANRAFLPGEAIVRDVLLHSGVAAARACRRRLDGPTFIGVTGSAGKTSTKDLIAAVLRTKLRGTQMHGGDNRLSTVGKAILRTRTRDAFCVAEVAAWFPGSVAEIASLLRPQIAVVTTVGEDHFSVFRGRDGTAREKSALVAALPTDGTAILNADDPYVMAMAEGFPGRVILFGEATSATLRAENVRAAWPETLSFTLKHGERSLDVHTQLNGRYWLTSVLAALGVASAMDVPLERAVAAVASFEPVSGRMSQIQAGGVTFLRDDRKAPLWSFDALFDFITDAQAPRKILVIGTISDYPSGRSPMYRKLAARALAVADEVHFVGPAQSALRARSDSRLRTWATVREAAEHLRGSLHDGDLVVLKGSNRADHLQRIALVWTTHVECWRTSCGRMIYCDDCRLLHVPGGPRAAWLPSTDGPAQGHS